MNTTTSNCCIEDERLAVLRQLLGAATHDASAAMCRWTDGLITMALDEVREIPLDEVCREIRLDDELLTMVVLNMEGDVGGALILAFDEQNARHLAAALLGRPVEEQVPWSELEKSALTETGNILGCAYMNAITRLIDRELVPSAPYFIQDYGASVIQQALAAQAAASDEVLICRTAFVRQEEQLNWHVLFVPTEPLRRAMEQAFHGAR
jgi:chemotaxis protein CheC